MSSQTWQEFFDSHAPHYLKNAFTGNTRAEVEFMLALFEIPAGSRILDLGCGVGRHSIELAKHGMVVTGVDISSGMLAEARRGAEAAGVQIEWIQSDATKFQPELLYDAVICICEGGFGLANLDEDPVAHDLGMLKTAYAALRPNGHFLLTALNGYALIRQMNDEAVTSGSFEPQTMIHRYENEWDLPEGKRMLKIKERLFISPEVIALLRHVGFTVDHVWGGTAGEWGRRPLKLDEVEAMYVCRKL